MPLASGMSLERDPADDPLAHPASEPLVPILSMDDGQADPVALATWHQALSNTVAVEVPHDLMGLWLYPSHGGVVLLGPTELSEDDLAIPLPSPHITPEQLQQLESVVVNAGYRSATCLPVRFGRRDVALLLVADLRPDRHGPVERVLLQCVTQRIGPMLGRIARMWKAGEGSASPQQERIAGLLRVLAQANRDAAIPQRFLSQISRGLAPLLPHEYLELLLADGSQNRYLRLGEHPSGALWSDPSLVISGDHLDVAGIFGGESSLIAEDIYDDARWPRGFLTAGDQAGADIRSLVGARLQLRNGTAAYLLVGSIGPDLYTPEDAELLALLAGLVTPQVAALLPREAPPMEPPRRPDPHPHLELLIRIAGLLATTPSSAVATELIAAEARATIPFDKLAFALRVPNADHVVLLEPGETRPLAGLPPVSVETALARVLTGDLPCAFEQDGKNGRMIVPLRVAGRVQGALIFSADSSGAVNEQHVVPAQQLADIVAAHLELWLRSPAAAPTRKPAVAQVSVRRSLPAYPATPRGKRVGG